MTTQAAKQDKKAAAKKPSFFKMRTQLLDQGRTNTLMAKTDNMNFSIVGGKTVFQQNRPKADGERGGHRTWPISREKTCAFA